MGSLLVQVPPPSVSYKNADVPRHIFVGPGIATGTKGDAVIAMLIVVVSELPWQSVILILITSVAIELPDGE